jgi:hypothetical protein
LEHLPIWPPESRRPQQSTLPPSRFGTKLPQTPRFNALRKRYEAKASWAQQQASDQEADAKLNGQLKICHGC